MQTNNNKLNRTFHAYHRVMTMRFMRDPQTSLLSKFCTIQRTKTKYNHKPYSSSLLITGILGISTFCYSSYSSFRNVQADNRETRDPHPKWQAGERINISPYLPTYTRKQVMQHNTETSLWLTYRHGVYDLTSFADDHPGALERLLLACQGNHDCCNWWEQLGYHNVSDVHYLLETFRIGNIGKSDVVECAIKDAAIDPILRVDRNTLKDSTFTYEAFIAETPIHILDEYYYTPAKYHYVRNHFPTPTHLDWDSEFTISGIGIPNNSVRDEEDNNDDEMGQEYTLKYKDILSLPSITRDAYLQCGGHRRMEYNAFGKTKGSNWNIGAIGNGKYKGVLLRDLLQHIGCSVDELYNNGDTDYHVWFVGADCAPDGEQYGVSIPLNKALDPRGDVMLAYEYNGEPLSFDHGYPVRCLVPGWVGARSVKWIENIIICNKECDLKSYTESYRMTKDSNHEMRALPVNSAIHRPRNGENIIMKGENNILCITGEAHSGDGKPIIRVDVSVDGGKTWNEAVILGENNINKNKWSWTKWKCDVDISQYLTNENECIELELVCCAMDLSHNRQPASCEHDLTFNPKGYSANCYHRINVNICFDG